jgi:hypothetical protein
MVGQPSCPYADRAGRIKSDETDRGENHDLRHHGGSNDCFHLSSRALWLEATRRWRWRTGGGRGVEAFLLRKTLLLIRNAVKPAISAG